MKLVQTDAIWGKDHTSLLCQDCAKGKNESPSEIWFSSLFMKGNIVRYWLEHVMTLFSLPTLTQDIIFSPLF